MIVIFFQAVHKHLISILKPATIIRVKIIERNKSYFRQKFIFEKTMKQPSQLGYGCILDKYLILSTADKQNICKLRLPFKFNNLKYFHLSFEHFVACNC